MKIKIQRSALLDALKKVQNTATGKGTLPVLQNVKMDAQDGKVTMTTSDLDLTIRTDAMCDVEEPGSTTLPVKLLSAAVSKLAEGQVSISVDEKDRAEVKAGNAKFKIAGIAANQFPTLPTVADDAASVVLPTKDLKDMLSKVQYAASQDETRRTLQGANVTFENGKVTVVATDGRRLAVIEKTVDSVKSYNDSVTIPRKTVQTLVRELGTEGDVTLVKGGTQFVIRLDGMEIYTKLLEDAYPNYRQVIPKTTANKLTIGRTELLEALDRVSVLSETTDSKSVKMHFGKGQIKVSAVTADVGDAEDSIAIKYDGEEVDVMFNPAYIMDALKAITDDEVVYEMNDGHSPAVIKDSNGFLYVLMPLRIQ